MNKKEAIQHIKGLRGTARATALGLAAAASLELGNQQVQSAPLQEKNEPQKEILMGKETTPSQVTPDSIPNDTIAHFGVFEQGGPQITPDSVYQTPQKEIDPVTSDKPTPDSNTPDNVEFDYVDLAVDYVDNYEELRDAQKEGKLSPEAIKEGKENLYDEAMMMNALEITDDLMLIKPMIADLSDVLEVGKNAHLHPEGSKEHNDSMTEMSKIAKKTMKNSEKSAEKILGSHDERMQDGHNALNILTGKINGKEKENIMDKLCDKTYVKSLKYIKEKDPELAKEREDEKEAAKKSNKRERMEERAGNGNKFAKVMLKITDKIEDRKEAKINSNQMSDVQKFKMMREAGLKK